MNNTISRATIAIITIDAASSGTNELIILPTLKIASKFTMIAAYNIIKSALATMYIHVFCFTMNCFSIRAIITHEKIV